MTLLHNRVLKLPARSLIIRIRPPQHKTNDTIEDPRVDQIRQIRPHEFERRGSVRLVPFGGLEHQDAARVVRLVDRASQLQDRRETAAEDATRPRARSNPLRPGIPLQFSGLLRISARLPVEELLRPLRRAGDAADRPVRGMLQHVAEVACREGERVGELAELGDGGGAVEGLQVGLREEGVVQQGDVGVAAENLGVGSDDVVVDVAEEFVGREAADGAYDCLDGGVEEDGMEFVDTLFYPLREVRGLARVEDDSNGESLTFQVGFRAFYSCWENVVQTA